MDRDSLIAGGGRGPAIVPGKPAGSVLISAVRQDGELKMPPGAKLSEQDIAALTEWIAGGAVWGKPLKLPQETLRLQPTAFRELPVGIARELQKLGCTILKPAAPSNRTTSYGANSRQPVRAIGRSYATKTARRHCWFFGMGRNEIRRGLLEPKAPPVFSRGRSRRPDVPTLCSTIELTVERSRRLSITRVLRILSMNRLR